MEALMNIALQLRANKNNKNTFAGFAYRSAEDILSALKPLLVKEGAAIYFRDTFDTERMWITTTLTYVHGETRLETTSSAKIDFTRKGLSTEQCCGAAISYCHKYALGNLFLIDDNRDPDSMQVDAPDLEKLIKDADRVEALTELKMMYPELMIGKYRAMAIARANELKELNQ